MSTRPRITLSNHCEFLPNRAAPADARGDTAAWQPVRLPHTWNARDAFESGVKYRRGWGSYRIRLPIETQAPPDNAAPGQWMLRLGGFYGVGDAWLDKRRIATFDGQYLGADIPLPALPTAPCGTPPGSFPAPPQRLLLRLTNRCARHVLPGIADPDFVLHGGLAGGAWLEWQPHCRLLDAVELITAFDGNTATLRVAGQFLRRKEALDAPLSVSVTLHAPDGDVVDRQVLGPSSTGTRYTIVFDLPKPVRWDVDTPACYDLDIQLLDDNSTPLDELHRCIGFREAVFGPDGFVLNGRRLPLVGCNRHEAMPGMGNALSDAVHGYDAALIKRMGMNFVRLSHYPQSPVFLDACDRLGLLVHAELASWKSVRGGRWLRNAMRQFEDMIVRDRHHPSVVIWGMGNEGRHRRAYLRLRELARRLDPDRPVTYAENHHHRAARSATVGIPDVWGCNYELDKLDEGARSCTYRSVLVTECANYPPATRGALDEEMAQLRLVERDVNAAFEHPAVAGVAIWCFADYGTYRKRRYRRHCGLVDAWRTPKLTAAWLQARFGARPVLRIAGNWGATGGETERRIVVITNCANVTVKTGNAADAEPLRLADAAVHELTLPWTGQALVASGTFRGRLVRETLPICGPPERVTVTPAGIADDTVACFDVRVLDAEGRIASDWTGRVRVNASNQARVYYPYASDTVEVAYGQGHVWASPDAELTAQFA